VVVILLVLPAWGGDKEKDEETVKNATTVLQEMLNSKAVLADLLAKARCMIVLPNVEGCRAGDQLDCVWELCGVTRDIPPKLARSYPDFTCLADHRGEQRCRAAPCVRPRRHDRG
jgi:hypothetical protein